MNEPSRDLALMLKTECEDRDWQALLLEDIRLSLWPNDSQGDASDIGRLCFDLEMIEYSATGFHQGDVLDMMWSSCRNGLN